MIIVAHTDTITYENINNSKIPLPFSEFSIFFIADIHRRKISDKTLDKITEQVDVVFIGGDLLERNVSINKMRQNLIKLKRWKKPLYFVWGNNDLEVDRQTIETILQEEDVIILEDDIAVFEKENEKINVVGFNYYFEPNVRPMIDWHEIDNTFTILLTHKPRAFFDLEENVKCKIDLVLAGHTHGGQIRIFGVGPYRKGGLSQYKNTNIFVTEGYGYTLLPFRLQTKAQCHIITLFHSPKNNSIDD